MFLTFWDAADQKSNGRPGNIQNPDGANCYRKHIVIFPSSVDGYGRLFILQDSNSDEILPAT
jgi:hypothetical protein